LPQNLEAEPKAKPKPKAPPPPERRRITLPGSYPISARAFAHEFLRVKPATLLDALGRLGEDTDAGDDSPVTDADVAELLCLELGHDPVRPARDTHGAKVRGDSVGTIRPPVVSIMGHVDHGKTTLVDALRVRAGPHAVVQSKRIKGGVAGTEAGGITQSLSTFQLSLDGTDNSAVTVLDTPGHAAFRAMRGHVGPATDIVVMVIAADDGVSAQTKEIIELTREGGQAVLVALTKIDKDGVDVESARTRIVNELMTEGVLCEDAGGDVQIVPVSGVTGEGLDDLVEGLLLQAEIMDLRADQDQSGEAVVIDAR